ncbi:MAG: hypothetical protein IID03_04285 [Candidatus Dadabacteria bacterium]|nr:hypothetical protein [Candidatus Dadabacteria bacterium]
MLDFKKEAVEYLENKKDVITKEPKQQKFIKAESGKSNLNIDNEISGEDANKPNEDSKSPEALKDQQYLVVNTLYKDLFDELILNEEELDEFKDLIVDSQVFTSKNYDSSLKNKDAKIIELLGEQDYEVYEEYNETLVHRMKIMQYKQQLALSDSTLSEEQETDLLNIMLEEGSDKNTLEESREFLDTEQIEVLEKFQNTISNTDEMSIESLPEY